MSADASAVVAFLFTDIVESTRRWETDPVAMGEALRRHDALVRAAVAPHDADVFKTIGDAFCIAFTDAADAAHAALDVQVALASEDFSEIDGIAVRMAIHAGVVERRDGDYFGQPLNRVARLLGIGHGGQILITPIALALARERLRAQALVSDLGAHRLRDIATIEHVYQLRDASMRERHPELKSLGRGLTNLPLQLTSFVGRDVDLRAVLSRVEGSRSVTIVGPGGVGKTRLAIAVGRELLEAYPDGVWFVDLAPIADPDLVAAALAAAIDVRVTSSATATDQLVHALANKRVVLILDNCEHVIETGVALARELLNRCEGLRIIATSREPLTVPGEFVYRLETLRVPPASVASPEEALDYGAVRLFVDRAHAVDVGFALTESNFGSVCEIVRRLDGIALAIELAAPRIATLPPAKLAARLDERFRLLTKGARGALPRQQTLRALIDWSYDLLSERERTIFRRIAIFAGGFTLDAATLVCADDAYDAWEILDALAALQSKSLVVADRTEEDARYRMLESTRAFALEKLLDRGERETIAAKHATYVATYLVEQSPLWDSMDEGAWKAAVVAELDNVRAALEWTIGESRDTHLGLRVLAPLHKPLRVMLHDEAIRWFEPARELARELDDPHLRATILRRYAIVQYNRNLPIDERVTAAAEALGACESCGDDVGSAAALALTALLLRDAGRFEDAKSAFERALSLAERTKTDSLRASIACDLALAEFESGDHARAHERIDACLRIAPTGTVIHASAFALLADIRFVEGDIAGAREAARIARTAYSDQREMFRHAVVLCNEAAYALAFDDLGEARGLLATALATMERVGSAIWRAIVIEHYALYAALDGDFPTATRLAGHTDARLRALGKVREPVEAQGFARTSRAARAALGDSEFDRLFDLGARSTDDEAARLARAMLAGSGAGMARSQTMTLTS